MSALGGLLVENGELLEEAQNRLAEARSIQETVLDTRAKHARARDGLVWTYRRLSRLASERGYPHEALEHAREAVRISERQHAAALRDLAEALALNGDTTQATARAQEALDLIEESTGPKAVALRAQLEEALATYRRGQGS